MPGAGRIHTMDQDNLDYAHTLSNGVALLREAQPPCATAAALDFAQAFAPKNCMRKGRIEDSLGCREQTAEELIAVLKGR